LANSKVNGGDGMNKLKQFREEAGLTQKQIAEKLGVSESYYCQLENNKRRMSLQLALDIAAILKKTPNDIFLPSTFAERQEQNKNSDAFDATGTE
jgi:DNA-binding XRE family transcriptional regulator